MEPFFIVLARDKRHVPEKIRELTNLKVNYLIICGEHLRHPNVVYRAPKGKYDAINFGAKLIQKDAGVVVLNDVDTKIFNFHAALDYFNHEKVALVFAKNIFDGRLQNIFTLILDAVRRFVLITANGELMLIRHSVLKEIVPLKPCKAEDTYILFKVLELGYKAVFCKESYVETKRTKGSDLQKEEAYKRIQVTGLYQALSYTKPPILVRLFFFVLPLMSSILIILGKKGFYWMKGILLGFLDYLRGDRSGFWRPTYME